MNMICKRPADLHPARTKGYSVKFNFDGDYEVRKDGCRVRGGFFSEEAAWHWADEYVRLGDGG